MDAVTPPRAASLKTMTASTTGAAQTAKLAQDFDAFLTLLTAQLRNQDPLSPMDPSEFTNQLTQLSQLEQASAQTDLLEQVNGTLSAVAARADLGFIGQRIETETDVAALVGGRAEIAFTLNTPADGVTVEILDASGAAIRTLTADGAAGARALSWDGRTDTGAQAPDGSYRMEITAQRGTVSEPIRPSATGVVSEIRFTEAGAFAKLDSGVWTPLDAAQGVGRPT